MMTQKHTPVCDQQDKLGRLLKDIRSIELSADAVKGGGDPLKALAQIKSKARAALFTEPSITAEHDKMKEVNVQLLEVAKMVDAWGHGLRHETAHENKMVKSARGAIAKATGE